MSVPGNGERWHKHMKFFYDGPREYNPHQPIFEEGKVTERVTAGLENALSAYVEIAKIHAPRLDNNPANYRVTKVQVVGSGARCNRQDSDLDLMLITPQLDAKTAQQMELMLKLLFYTDRQKREAVDVYVRPQDRFPERPSVDISDQVSELIKKYDAMLVRGDP